MCKVTQCPGPRLLFSKVNFNGQNQIGRPVAAYTLTQCMDDLTGLTLRYLGWVAWLLHLPYRETDRKEKLRAYKSLDAYNYVLNGPVQDLCVRSAVLPSQRRDDDNVNSDITVRF